MTRKLFKTVDLDVGYDPEKPTLTARLMARQAKVSLQNARRLARHGDCEGAVDEFATAQRQYGQAYAFARVGGTLRVLERASEPMMRTRNQIKKACKVVPRRK